MGTCLALITIMSLFNSWLIDLFKVSCLSWAQHRLARISDDRCLNSKTGHQIVWICFFLSHAVYTQFTVGGYDWATAVDGCFGVRRPHLPSAGRSISTTDRVTLVTATVTMATKQTSATKWARIAHAGNLVEVCCQGSSNGGGVSDVTSATASACLLIDSLHNIIDSSYQLLC